MIRVDLILGISILLSLSLLLVFTAWIFYNYRDDNSREVISDFHQCSYCTYVFFDSQRSEIITCPQCKSYLPNLTGKSNDAKKIKA